MVTQLPFISFYKQNNISPVNQDIADLAKHFERRDSLFMTLGIPVSFLSGSSVLEFGPGGGYNSLHLGKHSPRSFHLVDGNPTGIEQLKDKLAVYEALDINIHMSMFQDFKLAKLFDLVLAEGCVPHQDFPSDILCHMASFVKPGGIIVVSTNNGISYLSEVFRRLIFERFFKANDRDIEKELSDSRPFFRHNLSYLKDMSRFVDDWILDSIIQPLHIGKLFSIPEIIGCLGVDFEFYGSSPRFIRDFRWYKSLHGSEKAFNEVALTQYYQTNINLIDCRYVFDNNSVEDGMSLEVLCAKTWEIMVEIQNGNDDCWCSFFDLTREISGIVASFSSPTAKSIMQGIEALESSDLNRISHEFSSWWGRGQQYSSLIKCLDAG